MKRDLEKAAESATRELLSRQAAEWIAEEHGAPMGQPRRRGLLRWLRGSRGHVDAYLRAAVIEEDLRVAVRAIDTPLEELLAAARMDDAPVLLQAAPVVHRLEPRQGGGNGLRRAWTIAACLLLAVAIGLFGLRPAAEPVRYRTAHGEQKTLRLEDGTRLHLNVDTELTVDYRRRARAIELLRGQAFFEVAPDPRPLRVRIGQNVVRDIGTAFDVYRHGGLDTVSLVHGKVELWHQPESDDHVWLPWRVRGRSKASRIADLAPGMRISIDARGRVREDHAAGAADASAWTRDQIAFEDTPVEQVAAEFNRYNTIQLSIEDPRLAATRISGMFSSRDLDSFVLYLGGMPGTRVDRGPERIVLAAEKKTQHKVPDRTGRPSQ